jgi:hypothetical protein
MGQSHLAVPPKKVRTANGGYMRRKKAEDDVKHGRARWRDGVKWGVLEIIAADFSDLSGERSPASRPSHRIRHSPSLLVSAFCGSDSNLGQTFVHYPQNKVFA